ncbi:MAG TPA: trypsin-like peptidase domain-containing protein [Candidatus Thermoplasmatota archaeon]|nr:trypsin-like peptidase domain-containing protein [Candidatus Thermoplasmatota archaeon]
MFDEEKTTKAIEKVSPSVVSISIARTMRYDLFNSVEVKGVGSGIIMNPEGYVLTNNHVVEGVKKVDVFLCDGKKYEGWIVGTDPSTDIGVIKIEGHNFYSGEFGNSDELRPGQIAIAIGNSLGLSGGPTATVGVISAVRRNIQSPQGILENMIQTDAAINPGNSGGPLIDSNGKIIGINNAIIPYAQGIGFAIPINTAIDVANELLEYGRVVRPWIGIIGLDMSPTLASYYNLGSDHGALVVRINEDSPADHAGLRPGDIIIQIEDILVNSVEDVRNAVWKRKVGEKVRIKIIRKNQQLTEDLELDEMPAR